MENRVPIAASLVCSFFGGSALAFTTLWLGYGVFSALAVYSLGGAITLVLSATVMAMRLEKGAQARTV